MASIEHSTPADFGPQCRAMAEPELIAQQLVQQGAMHALDALLTHGCSEQTVQDMLASLRSNMLVIEAVAREKGFHRLFDDAAPEPVDHAHALHQAALTALSALMDGDPGKDSPQGRGLDLLADGIQAYEKATLPPPFGTHGHHIHFNKLEDALKQDEIKLLLEHGL